MVCNQMPAQKEYSNPKSWRDLQAEPGMIRALDYADSGAPAIRDNQDDKRRWSELLADACAWMIADGIRETKLANGLQVLPEAYGEKAEPVIMLGDSKKAVDVAVVTKTLLGLQVGFSLKGFNTVDAKSGTYDKNLKGRTADVANEMLFIHSHLPMAKMVVIYFMPLEAAVDKSSKFSSTFTRAVDLLDRQTGRAHRYENPENSDKSFIAIYSKNDSLGVERGVLRFFDVSYEPEGAGLPIVLSTLSLAEILASHCFLDPRKRNKPQVLTEHL